MAEKENKTKVLQIRMEPDMYDTLQLFAETYGMTISKYCYKVLDQWILTVIEVKDDNR